MASFQQLSAVDVSLFLETRAQTTQNFSFPMCIVPSNVSTNRLLTLTSASDALSAGFATNSPAHKMVNGFYSGIAPAELFKIARANLTTIELTVDSVPAVGEDISVNINIDGTVSVASYTIVTEVTNELDEAATGLAAVIDTLFTDSATATSAGNVITITPDTSTVSVGWNSIDSDGVPHIYVVDTTSEDVVTVLELATVLDDDFHFLLATTRESADVVKLADWASSNSKQYFTSTGDVNVTDNADTSNIATTLLAKAQDYVSLMYHSLDEYYFPEATLVGCIADLPPYQLQNPNFVTLSGIPVDTLTASQVVTMVSRNTNYYTTDHGYSVYKSGLTMGSNFVDVIRNGIWAQVSTQLALTALLKQKADRGSAVPYSDAGAAMMEQRVYTDVINVGIRGGTIATGYTTDPDTGATINLNPVINFSTRAQQTNANISNRVWDNAVIEYVYISGTNYIKVKNYVILNRDPA
jgi:hypothetical protein